MTMISFKGITAAWQSRTTAAIVAASLWAGRMTETRAQPSVPADSLPILAARSIALETFIDEAQGAPAGVHRRRDCACDPDAIRGARPGAARDGTTQPPAK